MMDHQTQAGAAALGVSLRVLGERIDGHERRDEDRFDALGGKIDRLDRLLEKMADAVGGIAADVSEIKGRLAGGAPAAAAAGAEGWRIGPRARAAIAGAATIVCALVFALAHEIYDLQPARMRAAQSPQPVQVVRAP
jgi:hypothetical protein